MGGGPPPPATTCIIKLCLFPYLYRSKREGNCCYAKKNGISAAVGITSLQRANKATNWEASHTIIGTRCYSTITHKDLPDKTEFYEWFCGFVDEGSFRIKKDSRRDKTPYSFEFRINLHLDDISVLYYIQKI